MTYFDKLIHRLAGGGYQHTLNPEAFSWEELYDPFESIAVLPLSYPSELKRQAKNDSVPTVASGSAQ